jgi:uncharacterized GH25 family protein
MTHNKGGIMPFHFFRYGAAAIAMLLAPFPMAQAHTSYLLPNLFNANQEEFVTLQSAFSEHFFQPEVAVDAADFHVILPDGSRGEMASITKLKQVVLLESPLKADGTYRFTTGVRLGRVGKMALVKGEWKPMRGDTPPEGATQFKTTQTETVADVYVSKKAPTRPPVDKLIGRLIIKPVSHPSDVVLGAPFKLQILFDGQPMAGQLLMLDRGGQAYDGGKSREIRSDAQGMVSLQFDKAGIYEIMTRHRARAPQGAPTDERSYTSSLTFEVQKD